LLHAQGANQPFLETFSLILQDELDRRQSRLIKRRYQQSGLEEKLTLIRRVRPANVPIAIHTAALVGHWCDADVARNLPAVVE
jgi:hypothetical protein